MSPSLILFFIACEMTAISSALLGFIVYIRDKIRPLNRTFILLSVSVTLWSGGLGFVTISTNKELALLLCKIEHAGVIFIPITFFHFSTVFLNINKDKIVSTLYLLGLCFLLLIPSNLIVDDVSPKYIYNYMVQPGIMYGLLLVLFFLSASYGFYLLASNYKSLNMYKKNQAAYVILAGISAFVGGIPMFFTVYKILDPPFYLMFINSTYPIITSYAILRHQLMDINFVIRKGLLYSLLIGLLSALYLSAVFIFGNYLGGRKSVASILFTILSIVFFSIIFQPLRDKIQEFIDKVFFRGKYDYQKTLKELSLTVCSIAGIDELLDKVLASIVDIIKIKNASIFILDKSVGEYLARRSIGQRPDRQIMSVNKDIVSQLITEKEAIPFNETARNDLNAAIIFPIISKEQLIGALALGEKLSGEIYSGEDIDLLTTLCAQIGISIENAMLYEDALEAQKRLYQADKLATVGALAAGLAHEIKNPIAAIKGFSQMLNKVDIESDNEALKDFKEVVPRQLDRINEIVGKLLTLSKPAKIEIEKVDVIKLLNEIIKLVEKQALQQNVVILKNYAELPQTLADPGQLTQAFLNLLLNAIQSMPDGGQVEIRAKCFGINKIIVEFTDNGSGISKEIAVRIFDPFNTSKSNGCGLGLSVTQKIILDHHGTIDFRPAQDRGTVFTITLPIV